MIKYNDKKYDLECRMFLYDLHIINLYEKDETPAIIKNEMYKVIVF